MDEKSGKPKSLSLNGKRSFLAMRSCVIDRLRIKLEFPESTSTHLRHVISSRQSSKMADENDEKPPIRL